MPAPVPVMLPEPSTVATDGLLLLQLPPAEPSLRVVVVPWHIVVVPVIPLTVGVVFTVMFRVTVVVHKVPTV